MRLGPKALVGLGLPAALRPHAPDKGVGAFAITLNHTPILLNGQSINLSKGILT